MQTPPIFHHACEQFIAAIIRAGLTPPDYIINDGKMHRFFSSVSQKFKKNGWYVFYPDHPPSGSFGCWKLGIKNTFSLNTQNKKTTEEERKERATVIERQQKERQEEKRKAQIKAAFNAALMLKNASLLHNSQHKYLIDTGLKDAFYPTTLDSCIKENIKTKELFVRVEDVEGVLMTVQVIDEYGNKEFLAGGAISGHFARIGTLNNVDSIVLCEGIATALSIHEATGFSVVAVLTAQNYLAVAEAIRKKYPNLFFIFCADDDSRKNQLNNTGKIKADEARNKFDGVVAMPDFDDDPASRGLTDFNDMHRIYGVKRVREAIEWARKHNIKT